VERTKNCPEPELLSLHAFGLLEPSDCDRVERHLSTCPACRVDVAALADTLGALALAAPVETPSPDLRVRVLRTIDQSRGTLRRPARPLHIPMWSLGLAVAAVIMAIGLITYRESPSPHFRAIQQAVADAKRQGARVMALEGTKDAPKARGEMYVVGSSGGQSRVVVAVEGLAEPSGEGVYCLWLIKNGKRSVGGWVTVDSSGKGGLVFDTAEAFDTIGVTLEPDADYHSGPGGQLVPRGPKVLGVPQV